MKSERELFDSHGIRPIKREARPIARVTSAANRCASMARAAMILATAGAAAAANNLRRRERKGIANLQTGGIGIHRGPPTEKRSGFPRLCFRARDAGKVIDGPYLF